MHKKAHICSNKSKSLDENETKIILDYISSYDHFLDKIAAEVNESCRKLDQQDVKQQLILTLFTSVKHYDGRLGASYSTYLSQIVINAKKNMVRAYWQDKNRANAEAVSLDSYISEGNGEDSFISLVSEDETSFLHPKSMYEIKETFEKIDSVYANLSKYESEVFNCYLQGESIEKIAKKTGKTSKAVYNTIFKLKNLFSKEINK